MAVTFDNDVFNLTDDHVEVQSHVAIRKTNIDVLFSRDNTQPGQNQGKNLAQDCVAVTFDNDVFNLTDDHVEVQPHVPIRKTEIDILFSRDTVNKYDFWSLTPFAFGISPELSAENKKKSDARKRDFDKKEALLRLDPMYQHKYTHRMCQTT